MMVRLHEIAKAFVEKDVIMKNGTAQKFPQGLNQKRAWLIGELKQQRPSVVKQLGRQLRRLSRQEETVFQASGNDHEVGQRMLKLMIEWAEQPRGVFHHILVNLEVEDEMTRQGRWPPATKDDDELMMQLVDQLNSL